MGAPARRAKCGFWGGHIQRTDQKRGQGGRSPENQQDFKAVLPFWPGHVRHFSSWLGQSRKFACAPCMAWYPAPILGLQVVLGEQPMRIKRKYCKHCKEYRKFESHGANHLFHLIATLVTFGVWGIVWFFDAIFSGHWRCSVCGGK